MIKLGIYTHYKDPEGKEYLVNGVAINENTEEPMVIYKALYGDKVLYTRPLDQFVETVEWNGEQVPRFNYIREME